MSDKELKGRFIKGNKTFTYFRPMRKRSSAGYLFVMLVNLFYTLLIRLDSPKRNQKRKYHISLCIMFKDEAPYLREWIEYHRMIGVDHFYMYDNNSSDGFEEVLAPYQEEGLITLIPWSRQHAQVDGYEDCIRQFQDESDWIGFIDVDEFLVPIEEESLAPVLDRFCHCPAVLVYWRFFGSGGMLQRDRSRLVIEDFVVASEKLYTKGKCFFNSNYDYLWDHSKNRSMFHMLWTVSHGIPVPPVDIFGHTTVLGRHRVAGTKTIPMQLNHYAVKSLEEHREKNLKGDVYYDHPTHGDEVFFGRDLRCDVPDYRIHKYLSALKLRLNQTD